MYRQVFATNIAMSPATDLKSCGDLENRVKVTKIDWGLRIPLMYAVIKFEAFAATVYEISHQSSQTRK